MWGTVCHKYDNFLTSYIESTFNIQIPRRNCFVNFVYYWTTELELFLFKTFRDKASRSRNWHPTLSSSFFSSKKMHQKTRCEYDEMRFAFVLHEQFVSRKKEEEWRKEERRRIKKVRMIERKKYLKTATKNGC